MNAYTFHITPYDLVFLGTIFTGLTFTMQLWFTKRINRTANRFLGLALATIVLWMIRVVGIDMGLGTGLPHWSWLPLQFSLALGPLIYFYVLKITRPEYNFRYKDLLHFSPLLLESGAHALEVSESARTSAATYDTLIFRQINPVLYAAAFVSVSIYLYASHRLIGRFYRRLKFTGGDRYRHEMRWLHKLLIGFGIVWLLWIPFTVAGYYYHSDAHFYYPLYFLLGVITIWIAAKAFSKPEVSILPNPAPFLKPPLPAEMKQRGIWLKKAVQTGRYYQDPELSLTLLAERLELTTHELSRIINTALKKSFNDFVNEYRIAEVARKMQDPAYDNITLLGIAFESGFNSKSTFNRAFKQMTGKSAAEYKNELKKQRPSYNLTHHTQFSAIISYHKTTPTWTHEKLNRNFMFKNYFKTAWRSLKKNKGFTAINVLGLSVGLATCLLIVFYVVDELSYDRYNVNAGNIYRITEQVKFNGNEGSYAASEAPLMANIKSLQGIAKYARMLPTESLFISPRKYFIKKGTNDIQENNIIFAEPNIFDVFTLPMIAGSPSGALTEPHSVVLTESAAKKYFNKTDVIGQVLTLNDTGFYKVTGVLKDIPAQSHFNYNVFVSFSSIPESKVNSWGFGGLHTYLMLKPGTNVKALQAAITKIEIANSYSPKLWSTGDNYFRVVLTPLLDIHLRSSSQYELSKSGNIQYVYIFSVIAIFILLIACVNFMNLSTARSSNRAKEVGVRKVLGSARKYLVAQFLTESFLVTLIATIIALVLVWLLLPLFNHVADKQLSFTVQSMVWLLPSLLGLVLVISFLAGSYPALFLSAFQPIDVLKGKISAGFKGGFLRSFLVVFQFAISIFLIIGTLVIYNQLNYIHSKSLGFNRSQVLVINNVNNLGKNAKLLKQELKQFPGVTSATMSGYLPTGQDRIATALFPHLPIDMKDDILTQFWPVDEDYIGTMGIRLVAGRNFSSQMATDTAAVIVNEAFVKRLGVKNPLGKTVFRDSYGVQPYHIIGVMKDFNFSSLHDEIGPAVLYDAEDRGAISAKIKTANLPALLSQVESKWKSLAPNQPFAYSFMDQDFDATYRSEQRIGTLFIAFSTLAILIACLGLFGLAAYAAEQRNKEIGIRKVLGASVSGIVSMLSMNFIKLVFISILIASPIAWWAMSKWLQGFAYRIDVSWWIVAVAGLTAIFIAFVTISFQSIRAAIANPVDSLRSE
ncbi:ABC transporter permease [Mucilaginibacter sp. BJC16-A38]|uniref:ABC transporter permease n=1 Tax=Mucilaginibacter phenanthrenivorans TaxID=1234842 RepID=UPI002158262A|nr:ABC transporter permease [Mucilaginibacter phenanthrenivorans]MCR8561581.1 ABC transporter permease [Mucilaginibacter phenanthrenivorans]